MIRALFMVLGLAILHVVVGFLPGHPLTLSTNIVLFAANLYVLYCVRLLLRDDDPVEVALFATGYFILFTLVLVVLERESLFILLILVYASVFRVRELLGYFGIFVVSYVILQPYGAESFWPLAFLFFVVWRAAKGGASRFALVSLGVGLAALMLLLFPLFFLIMQDSPRTLAQALGRDDVQRALWTSVATSSVATLVVTAFGIPLAYALARLRFAGKATVETLVDLPILVPQSVVGVALLSLLGPRSPLGELLLTWTGIQISGSFLGIILAQVFVAAPFLIKTAMTAFEGVPPHLERAARTLGATPRATFWRVTLPLASRGVLIGMILAWSRAISEFGSILLFATHPMTAPILLNMEMNRVGVTESRPIAVLLLLICLWIFVMLQFGQMLLPKALQRAREGGRL